MGTVKGVSNNRNCSSCWLFSQPGFLLFGTRRLRCRPNNQYETDSNIYQYRIVCVPFCKCLFCCLFGWIYSCVGHGVDTVFCSRNLITRCREHLGINKAGQKIKVSPSAIGDHINQSGHAVSLEDFLVLDRANNDFDLLFHESLLILRDRPSLNSQQSSIPLVLF